MPVADAYSSFKFGQGEGVIHITYARCADTDSKLLECDEIEFYGGINDHYDDVGIKCYDSGNSILSLL